MTGLGHQFPFVRYKAPFCKVSGEDPASKLISQRLVPGLAGRRPILGRVLKGQAPGLDLTGRLEARHDDDARAPGHRGGQDGM